MTVNLEDHQLVNWDCSEDQYFDLCHVTNSVLQKMINKTQNTELQWGSCLSIQPSTYSSIFYSWSQSPFFSLPISILPLIALLCLLKSSFAKYIRLRWWSGKMLRYWSASSQRMKEHCKKRCLWIFCQNNCFLQPLLFWLKMQNLLLQRLVYQNDSLNFVDMKYSGCEN